MELRIIAEIVSHMEKEPELFGEYGMVYYFKHTDFSEFLDESKSYTFFIPKHEVLQNLLLQDAEDPFIADKEFCKKALMNIIVPEKIHLADLKGKQQLTTLGGKTIDVSVEGDEVVLNKGIHVTEVDELKLPDASVFLTDRFLFVDHRDMAEFFKSHPHRSFCSA